MNRTNGQKIANFLFWVGFASLLFLIWVKIYGDEYVQKHSVLNNQVQFSMPGFDVEGQILSNETIKKPALINFFGSWCGYCKYEHKFLMELAKDKDINIYGIAHNDNATDLRMYLAKYDNPYKMIGLDTDGVVSTKFGVDGVPANFIIDKNGNITNIINSNINQADLEGLRKILKPEGVSSDSNSAQ